MAIKDSGKNLMLTELGSILTHMSLHTAYPPTSGNELTGGAPAYKRQPITWGSASLGKISITNQPTFDVPAGKTIASVAYTTALTAGTIHADYDVVDEVYAGQGTYTVTSSSIDLNK